MGRDWSGEEAAGPVKRTFWGLVLAGALVASPQLTKAQALSPLDELAGLKIRLRVYNYGISPALLFRAEGEATGILNQAGVEAAWLDCPLTKAEFASHPACQATMGPAEFAIKILTARRADGFSSQHEALGQALECRQNQVGCGAYIFYRGVLELARDEGVAEYQLLGHALAHEIGHLLLGPDSHSSDGVMRANWAGRDLQTIARARLAFSSGQSEAMREVIRERNAAQQNQMQSAQPALAAVAQLAPDIEPALTPRVYNYAHLDPGLLTGGENVAASILKHAGVATTWAECPLSPADFGGYPGCQKRMQTTDFLIRLLSASMAAKFPVGNDSLGFAQPCAHSERGCMANVFYAKVDELASGGGSARILGHVMAHEVGHLLLGANAHSSSGVMLGVWYAEDRKLMRWGELMFAGRQSDEMRDNLLRRARLEVASYAQAAARREWDSR